MNELKNNYLCIEHSQNSCNALCIIHKKGCSDEMQMRTKYVCSAKRNQEKAYLHATQTATHNKMRVRMMAGLPVK